MVYIRIITTCKMILMITDGDALIDLFKRSFRGTGNEIKNELYSNEWLRIIINYNLSYYRLQGYTEIPIPSHREIQRCLYIIGDKPSSFIGSKQWIGSTEVSFVLQNLLNVDSKILCASSGNEMSSFIPQLAHHFDTQGTPIMIGKFFALLFYKELALDVSGKLFCMFFFFFFYRWRCISSYNFRSKLWQGIRRRKVFNFGSTLHRGRTFVSYNK